MMQSTNSIDSIETGIIRVVAIALLTGGTYAVSHAESTYRLKIMLNAYAANANTIEVHHSNLNANIEHYNTK